MSYAIVSTGDPLAIRCETCKGSGSIGDRYCWTCSGDGSSYIDQSELMTLAHNLGVVAALCKAFELARDYQHCLDVATGGADRRAARRDEWHPGCRRDAPSIRI